MLRVMVSAEGAARQVEIATSSGHAVLDESARSTVARWQFIPAKKDGTAVEAPFIVLIEFCMER